jgi:tRNA (uracil-5-)-methyltransferase
VEFTYRKFSGEFSLTCEYLGKCGSCFYFDKDYQAQLEIKKAQTIALLRPFYENEYEVFESDDSHFRARAEFRIYKDEGKLYYAMHDFDKKLLPIHNCPKVLHPIESVMQGLITALNGDEVLARKLYGVEFLSGLSGEVLVTLIYHKKLEQEWIEKAQRLEEKLGVYIIGRSKKQKEVISQDYIVETLNVEDCEYKYRHYEASFTQPNPKVNEKMIKWAITHADKKGDLLESYCGAGNFTIALAKHYTSVLANEISKKSIEAAKHNCALNDVHNISFVRLSSEELTQALNGVRTFNRLKGIELDGYDFQTVLVDPPRAGLDEDTMALIQNFEQIIYISCNPQTLCENLTQLCKTHKVENAALFDQFAFSKHIECGVILKKIGVGDGM